MNTQDRVTSFELQLTSADSCVGTIVYPVDAAGTVSPGIHQGWSDEPELHTEDAEITIVRASGKRDTIDLTGDQHRDLENYYSGYEDLFARIVGGESQEDALAATLTQCQEPPRSSPRP